MIIIQFMICHDYHVVLIPTLILSDTMFFKSQGANVKGNLLCHRQIPAPIHDSIYIPEV